MKYFKLTCLIIGSGLMLMAGNVWAQITPDSVKYDHNDLFGPIN
jgi:hypothetical protein